MCEICSDVYLTVESVPSNNLGKTFCSKGLTTAVCLGASGLNKHFCIKTSNYCASFFPNTMF